MDVSSYAHKTQNFFTILFTIISTYFLKKNSAFIKFIMNIKFLHELKHPFIQFTYSTYHKSSIIKDRCNILYNLSLSLFLSFSIILFFIFYLLFIYF